MSRAASRGSKFVVPPELRRHLNPRKRPRTESPKSEVVSSTRIKASTNSSENSDYDAVSNAGSGTDPESEVSVVESLAPALAQDSDLEYCNTDLEDTDGENDGPALGIQHPPSRISKGPADISRTSGDDPIIVKAPRGGYPKTVNAGKERRERSFQPGWAKSYKWLEYSLSADMMYCHRCRHFGDGSLPAWEGDGTRAGGWKKATEKLKEHALHSSHKQSEGMFVDWEHSQKTGGIRGMVLEGAEKTAMDNRIYISSVAEVVNFCGRQALPLRGHDESASSDNRGNFIELLDLVGQHDLVVRKKLSAEKAFYTSPQIQNEMIQIQSGLIQSDLAAEVREAGMFSLQADESKDLGKHEQVSISVRYWHSGAVREAFLSFVRAEALTAESLTADIVKAVEDLGLSLLNCVSQSYDGAAVMSGSTNGVQTRIKALSGGRALFVHCSAHRLNLAVVGAIRQISRSADLFQQLSLLYNFMSTTVVYTKYEELRGGVNRLTMQRLSDTRWVCQYAACHNARVNIGVVVDVLEFYIRTTGSHDADRRSQALMIMGFIDTVWIMELCIMEEVLARLKSLHLTLQSEQLDLASATLMIEGLVEHCSSEVAILSAGEGASTEAWVAIYAKFIHVLGVVDLPAPRARPVRRARRDAAANAVIVYDTETDNRQKLYLPIVRAVCAELKRRFHGGTDVAFGGIDSLHPTSPNFLSLDGLKPFAEHYGIEIDTLRHDVSTYRTLVTKKCIKDRDFEPPTCLSEMVNLLTPYEAALPALLECSIIAITIPVGTAGCERSFSVMRRVKTWLRCTTSDERLSSLAVLAVHRRRAKELGADNWKRVVAKFRGDAARRINIVI